MKSSYWMQRKPTARSVLYPSSRSRSKIHFRAIDRPSAVVPGEAECQQQATPGHFDGKGLETRSLVLNSIDHDQPACSSNYNGGKRASIPDHDVNQDHGAVISVCMGKHCAKRGSKDVMQALSKSAKEFPDTIEVTCSSCLGQCKRGPSVHVKMSSGEEVMCVRVGQQNSVRQLTLAALDDLSLAF